MADVERIGNATLYHGNCLEILPTLPPAFVVVTDPPYGMGNHEWDGKIPNWLPLVSGIPAAVFCGVVGMRDYPVPDWIGAWVRPASSQRNGKLKGFNHWEPILFYALPALKSDVIVCQNSQTKFDHPCVKPIALMERLVSLMPPGTVLDAFMGSGSTGVACANLGREFIGIEIERRYFDLACERITAAYAQGRLFA